MRNVRYGVETKPLFTPRNTRAAFLGIQQYYEDEDGNTMCRILAWAIDRNFADQIVRALRHLYHADPPPPPPKSTRIVNAGVPVEDPTKLSTWRKLAREELDRVKLLNEDVALKDREAAIFAQTYAAVRSVQPAKVAAKAAREAVEAWRELQS